MATIRSALSKYKRFGQFTYSELFELLLTSITFGFILSFNKWGNETFNAEIGFRNLIGYSAISLLAMLIMIFGSKFAAVQFGFESKYKLWKTGLGISFLACVLTNGIPIILTTGGLVLKSHEGLQTGKFFRGPVRKHRSHIAFFGIFSLVIYATIIKSLKFLPESTTKIIINYSLLIGAFSLIPFDLLFVTVQKKIPNSNGCYIIGSNISRYIFVWVFLISSWLLIWFVGFWSLIIGIILGTIAFIAWILWGPYGTL